jgi:hypothetical protein
MTAALRSAPMPLQAPIVVLLLALVAGCAHTPNTTPEVGEDQLDRRILLHSYYEEGSLVTLAVNTDSTRRRESAPFVPFGIIVANNGLPRLTLTRESLTLVDDRGGRYPLATVEEAQELRGKRVADLYATRSFVDVFARRLTGRTRIPSVFYPIPTTEDSIAYFSRAIVNDTVELPRHAWMVDVVYFPHPEGSLLGRRYELWLDTAELDDPVFVRFEVN